MKERQEERLSLSPYDWGKGLDRGLRPLITKEEQVVGQTLYLFYDDMAGL